MLYFNRQLIFVDRTTGKTSIARDGAEAAKMLKANPNLTEYAGSGTFQTLKDCYGVEANGDRTDGGGFLGNLAGNPGYTPGQNDAGCGGGFLHNLLFGSDK